MNGSSSLTFKTKISFETPKTLGPINDNGEWRSRQHVEIRNLYRDHDVTAHDRVRRLR
jgi:hypothetical protein